MLYFSLHGSSPVYLRCLQRDKAFLSCSMCVCDCTHSHHEVSTLRPCFRIVTTGSDHSLLIMSETQPEHFRRGRRLDDDARRILVNLSQYYPAAILASRSGVSLSTLYRVLDSHRQNGDVHARRLAGPGRPRLLGYEDTRVRDCARSICSIINSSAKFLVGSLEYRGDAYLDKLRNQIRRGGAVTFTYRQSIGH